MGHERVGQWRWHARWGPAAAVVLVLTVAGGAACGGGGDDPAEGEESASSATTSTTPESTSTTVSPTQEVEEAFLAFSAMVDRLLQAPDPDDPEIAQRASGETLAGMTDSQTTLQTTGFSARLGERSSVEVLSVTFVDPATALVRECRFEDLTEVNAAGETNGPFVRTYWTEWTMIRVGEAWLADSSDGIDRRDGEHPCE